MDKKNNGGNLPAFPMLELDRISGQVVDQHFGVTLRDYFAAKALSGLATSQDSDGTWQYGCGTTIAREAYEIADAMLAERAK